MIKKDAPKLRCILFLYPSRKKSAPQPPFPKIIPTFALIGIIHYYFTEEAL